MTSLSSQISLRSFYDASTQPKPNSLVSSIDFNFMWRKINFYGLSGQAGRGNNEEFGLLSLEFDENFCMGGPGIIMSRQTLKRGRKKKWMLHRSLNDVILSSLVAPHIPTCLKNLYSTHEDVEVGRCVQKFAGIPCTWNYEVCLNCLAIEEVFSEEHSSRCNRFSITTRAGTERFRGIWRRKRFTVPLLSIRLNVHLSCIECTLIISA